MKRSLLYICGGLLLATATTACRDEQLLTDGEGSLQLTTSVMSDVKVVSRALSAEDQAKLCNTAVIWISDQNGKLIREYNGIGSVPSTIPLSSGHYYAEAWVGDSVPASWDQKHYHGYYDFDIPRGNTTQVNLSCPILNTLVSVKYGSTVAEVLDDYTLTVALNDGITDDSHSLTFVGDTDAKGYYMINSRTKGFKWTLSGKEKNGTPFTKSGEYVDAKVAEAPFLSHTTEYVFNIKYDFSGDIEIGGAYLSIDVIPEPVEGTEEEVLITLAPTIQGTDFDIESPVMGEPGNVGRKSLLVSGSSPLTSVVIDSDVLMDLTGYQNYDLLTMDAKYIPALNAAGINFATYNADNNVETDKANITKMRINLENELTATLPVGDYTFTITATDLEGKANTSTLTLSISQAPVIPTQAAPASITYTSATLKGTVLSTGAEKYGFEVRKSASSRAFEDWTFVEATVNGSEMAAEVSGLEIGTEYEFRAVADDFKSVQIVSFSTLNGPQLPNAGFESWQDSSSPYLIYGAGEAIFWDSGNHGSATMSKNVTLPDNSIKHSGSRSVKLSSQFVGVGLLGKFAAGNIFIGEYLETQGTNGVLGWGRKFDFPVIDGVKRTPKAVKGYVKYTPVAISSKDSSAPAEYVKGDMDKGIIYFATLSEDAINAKNQINSDNSKYDYPVIVRTKEVQLFDKAAPYVLSYGELILTEATAGSGMIEFTIPVTSTNSGDPIYIMLVASASKGGDYFTGGNGSTMWLDDIELVY